VRRLGDYRKFKGFKGFKGVKGVNGQRFKGFSVDPTVDPFVLI